MRHLLFSHNTYADTPVDHCMCLRKYVVVFLCVCVVKFLHEHVPILHSLSPPSHIHPHTQTSSKLKCDQVGFCKTGKINDKAIKLI